MPEARFAAPDNAIAVARKSETGDESVLIAAAVTDKKTPTAAESSSNAPGPPAIAVDILPANPVVVENKVPDPPTPVEVLVSNARKAYRHRFKQVGIETQS